MLFIASCMQKEPSDSHGKKAWIDQLPVSKTITAIETDSMGKGLDTLSVEYLKLDDQHRKRYSKKINWIDKEKTVRIDYFSPDGTLFFQEVYLTEDILFARFEAHS
ncbi:MAG: hypothetical protein R2792_03695 [Saprospiraceae bacterium]